MPLINSLEQISKDPTLTSCQIYNFYFLSPRKTNYLNHKLVLEKNNLPSAQPSEACKAPSSHRGRKKPQGDKKGLQILTLPHAPHALPL